MLVKDIFHLPSEGCAVVEAGILSVTLKSRPFKKWLAKAKSNTGKAEKHSDACGFWEYSGSIR